MPYKMAVRVASSFETLKSTPDPVNNENSPVFVDSPYFTGEVLVRVHKFSSDSDTVSPSTTPYFDGKRRLYSIEVKGRFKHVWQVDDLWFGVVMDRPLARIPTGADVGLKIARMIDPAIMADLKGPQPYSLSPLLCAVQALNIVPVPPEHRIPETRVRRLTVQSHTIPREPKRGFLSRVGGIFDGLGPRVNPNLHRNTSNAVDDKTEQKFIDEGVFVGKHPLWLPSWRDGHDGFYLEEKNSLFVGKEMSVSDRKKYFLKDRNRESCSIGPNEAVAFDFYNQYLDLAECQLRLPGMSFDLMKYNDGRPLRYLCQSKDASVVFFAIEFSYEFDRK